MVRCPECNNVIVKGEVLQGMCEVKCSRCGKAILICHTSKFEIRNARKEIEETVKEWFLAYKQIIGS